MSGLVYPNPKPI